MGKRIYWALVVVIAVFGMGFMIYYGVQPRPIPKIKLSQFDSPTVLANSLLLRLREEIKMNSVLFLGVEPEHPEQLQVWRMFLNKNQDSGSRFDVIVIDQYLNAATLFPEATVLNTKAETDSLAQGIDKATAAGKRVAVITASIYSSQLISGNVISNFRSLSAKSSPGTTDKIPMSLSIVDFPRDRGQEKSMLHPCVVEGVDQTGLGPIGCMTVQTARGNYLKRYPFGSWVGLVNQVGLKDYLVLYTQEK